MNFDLEKLRKDLEAEYDRVLVDSNSLKAGEVALQNVIENATGKVWWMVCDADIFALLLAHQGKKYVVDKIIEGIERSQANGTNNN